MHLRFREVLREIEDSLIESDFTDLEQFIELLLSGKVLITYGAGRVGIAMRGFAKRLRHLGLDSFFLEDSTVPVAGTGDILLLGSGSGRTASVRAMAEVAKSQGLKILLITTDIESPIAQLSNRKLVLNTGAIHQTGFLRKSIQPMTTLFEQSLSIVLDSLVLELMQRLNETDETMRARHNVIE
jgi:6-phospho-3-hexuloisomerase